jgi:hypothetical protein
MQKCSGWQPELLVDAEEGIVDGASCVGGKFPI